MTGFALFAGGFLLGAVPGLIVVVRNMIYSYRLTKRVERLAWSEGQRFYFSDPGTKLKLLRDPESLISSTDSEALATAKRQAIAEGPRIIRRHLMGGAMMFVGALSGAFIGYRLALFLGLPV